jgi:CHAT domain-containing protein
MNVRTPGWAFLLLLGTAPSLLPAAFPTHPADAYRARAEALYYGGHYPQALVQYRKAYELVKRSDGVRAANLCVDISTIHYTSGDYGQAATLCYRGLSHLKGVPDAPDSVLFKLYSSLGEMYTKLGNRDSCAWFFDQGNRMVERNAALQKQIPAYVLYHFNNQGLMHVRTGNYSSGIVFLRRALLIAGDVGYAHDAAVVRNNLALLYEQRGEYPEALRLRRQALAAYPAEDIQKCLILSGIGWNLMHAPDYPAALRHLEQSLALYRKITKRKAAFDNPAFEANLLNNFGRCYGALGRPGAAVRAYTRAAARLRAAYGPQGKALAESYLGLAVLHDGRGDFARAVACTDQAIAASGGGLPAGPAGRPRLVYEKTFYEVLRFRGELACRRHGQQPGRHLLEQALEAYQAAIGVAHQLRRSYNASEASLYFQSTVYPVYESAFETAYALYRLTGQARYRETAFGILEKSRAAVLADGVRELNIRPRNIPPALLDREQQLQQEISALKYGPPGGGKTAPGGQLLLDKEIQLAGLLDRFEREYPQYYQAKYSQPGFSTRTLQKTLDARSVYVTYHWKKPFLYTGVVTRAGCHLGRLRIDGDGWERHTRKLRAALAQNPGLGGYDAADAAIQLYQWLLEPVARHLAGKGRLIISRGGELSWLPFEVLETGKTLNDFLGKRLAITYVYTAATYGTGGPAKRENPSPGTLCVAPYGGAGAVAGGAGRSGGMALPASAGEVAGIGGTVLVDREATKARFLRLFAAYPIVHLATHAQTDDREPANSFIAFFPQGAYHKLYTEEIYHLDCRNTQLVVLSACKTGTGKMHRGEGLMSLARAFAFAGCPAVVTSLWDSHDGSAAYLAQRFHVHVRRGLPLDEALRQARLDFLGSDWGRRFNHPYYWANFVLIGRREPVYAGAADGYSYAAATALVLLALLGGWAVAARRGYPWQLVRLHR